ncbi:hypothetical protein KCU74_g101, partial [Aureobasidium melanogenum]
MSRYGLWNDKLIDQVPMQRYAACCETVDMRVARRDLSDQDRDKPHAWPSSDRVHVCGKWCRMGSSRIKCSGDANWYKVWLHDRNISCDRVVDTAERLEPVVTYRGRMLHCQCRTWRKIVDDLEGLQGFVPLSSHFKDRGQESCRNVLLKSDRFMFCKLLIPEQSLREDPRATARHHPPRFSPDVLDMQLQAMVGLGQFKEMTIMRVSDILSHRSSRRLQIYVFPWSFGAMQKEESSQSCARRKSPKCRPGRRKSTRASTRRRSAVESTGPSLHTAWARSIRATSFQLINLEKQLSQEQLAVREDDQE